MRVFWILPPESLRLTNEVAIFGQAPNFQIDASNNAEESHFCPKKEGRVAGCQRIGEGQTKIAIIQQEVGIFKKREMMLVHDVRSEDARNMARSMRIRQRQTETVMIHDRSRKMCE
jgi:hypothetical protein